MITSIYPFLYLGMLGSAVLWYVLNHKKADANLAKAGFWISALLYLPALLLADGSLLYKTAIVGRDFAILGGLVVLTNALLGHPKMLFVMLAAATMGLKFFYFGTLENTFSFNSELAQEAELLIDIQNGQQLSDLQEVADEYSLTFERAFPDIASEEGTNLDEYYAVNIPDAHADQVSDIMEALWKTGMIDEIDENESILLSPEEEDAPENTDRRINYGVSDPMLGDLWSFERMEVAAFYQLIREKGIQPKKKARVFILDTGIDGGHEDLKDNYLSVNARYDIDKQGHGTHCAGIAGAVSDNAKGIASLALNGDFVSVSSVKVLSDEGRGSERSIVQGIIKAADSGADVISMSLGGPSFGRKNKAYNDAIAYAMKKGAIVVAAAGNSSDNATDYVPASCDGVIAVSAVDKDLAMASFSNWVGDLKMGIAAPGVNIVSSFPNNKYTALSGTSMATPYVAGLLGILRSVNPSLTTEEAYKILNETGIDTKSTGQTGKFIQPAKAIEAALK